MKHRAIGDLQVFDASTVASLAELARRVRRRPLAIGVLTDEEVALLDDVPVNPVEAPRLATYTSGEQDVALAATMALLRARDELEWEDDQLHLQGVHAAVASMREEVTARVQFRLMPEGPGGWHALVDRIGTRDLAMARVIEQDTGIHLVTVGTPSDAMVWALHALGVAPEGDRRVHPAEPVVARADTADELDPGLLALEDAADVVLVVTAGADPPVAGGITVTSGPAGVHLHRGFRTTAGEEHTITHVDPVQLGEMLAILLDPMGPGRATAG